MGEEAVNGSVGHAARSQRPANGNGKPRNSVKSDERTDLHRWRLLDERGRQTWHYLESDEDAAEWPQSTADRYFLGLPLVRVSIGLP